MLLARQHELKHTLQGVVEDRGVGATYVVGRVTGPAGQEAEVRFLVDSGAMYSLLPHEFWRKLGLSALRMQPFVLADGSRIRRAVAVCSIALPQGELGETPVILGEPGDVALLGVVALEQLGLVLDPLNGELRPMEYGLLRIA